MADEMKDEMEGMAGMMDKHFEMKMRMMKMRDDMLNAMDEKELRAFIKGYLMAQMQNKKRQGGGGGCGCGGHCGCGGGEGSCDCKQ